MGKIIGMAVLAAIVAAAFMLFGDVKNDPVARVANLGVRAANASEIAPAKDGYASCGDQSVCLPDQMPVSAIPKR